MKFFSIYQRIIGLWPERIVIGDGYPVDPANEATPATTPNGGEKFCFPALNQAWDEAEDQIDPVADNWGDMMVWTMFQEFQREAKQCLKVGEQVLIPSAISQIALEKRYRSNLSTNGWEHLRDEYEG